MGSGGNMVRNMLTLADGYEQLWPDRSPMLESAKQQFFMDYYGQPADPYTWLKREWSIREGMYTRYYDNNIPAYYNPPAGLIFDDHGIMRESDLGTHLRHYDRYQIERGERPEQISDFTLADCTHVFITFDDMVKLTKIYNSKNPTFNQYDHLNLTPSNRAQKFQSDNMELYLNTLRIKQHLVQLGKVVYTLRGEDLFVLGGSEKILDLAEALTLNIDPDTVHKIHSTWLNSTREVYYIYYQEELKL